MLFMFQPLAKLMSFCYAHPSSPAFQCDSISTSKQSSCQSVFTQPHLSLQPYRRRLAVDLLTSVQHLIMPPMIYNHVNHTQDRMLHQIITHQIISPSPDWVPLSSISITNDRFQTQRYRPPHNSLPTMSFTRLSLRGGQSRNRSRPIWHRIKEHVSFTSADHSALWSRHHVYGYPSPYIFF